MSIVIFTGPTLSAAEARSELDADYLPPVAEGDVYRAARKRPRVIGIIDGYFERVPSVWHKEILWAMSQGIHVFGSASMGALRAAELAAFGMEGVGAIFEAYRDGGLEDDDEVAVVHASHDFEFRAGSEAMVDIRCTIGRAVEAGVLSPTTAAALDSLAKATFYPARNYQSLAVKAAEIGLPAAELSGFLAWLPEGRASQKRLDAIAMLGVIRERVANGLQPKRVKFAFENSSMWEQAWRLAGEQSSTAGDDSDTVLLSTVLEELRLEGEPFLRVQEAAILRTLALKQSFVQGLAETDRRVPAAARRFWHRTDLSEADAKQQWMRDNNLDEGQLAALLDDETRVQWIRSLAAFDAVGVFLDQLRVSGEYPRLVERARTKRRLLASLGLDDPTLANVEVDHGSLLEWYFETRLGRAVPANLDEYSNALGFDGSEAFQRSLLREYCFLQHQGISAGNGR